MTTTKDRFLLGAATAALATATLIGPAASAQTVPPDDTYEITGIPSVVRPGGTITFTGICWMNKYLGATTHVNVRGYLKPPAPEAPFGFRERGFVVDRVDGSFSGRIAVPSDAPEGEYSLTSQCITEDQVPGGGRTTFVVEGDPLPTTSTSAPVTSTPSAPVTSTTVVATPTVPGAAPPPANPRAGTPVFTG